MKFQGIKPGDEVIVRGIDRSGGARRKVEKVGRKYFTIGRNQYRIDNGMTNSGYSWPSAESVEEHELGQRVAAALKALSDFGVRLDHFTKTDKVLLVYETLRPHIERATQQTPVARDPETP